MAKKKAAAGLVLEKYRGDLYKHEKQILALGMKAIPMLVEAMGDEEQAWVAANLLGRIGEPSKPVLAALRKHLAIGIERCRHDATALLRLGDFDYVIKLSRKAKYRPIVVSGFKSLYSSFASECPAIDLDFRPLERLMEDAECAKQAREYFSFGSVADIDTLEIDEAMRGLESSHGLIRRLAVEMLGNPRLGVRASSRILPAIVLRLEDNDPYVRRFAVHSLRAWGKLAKPYSSTIRKMTRDSDENVRHAARLFLRKV